METGTQDDSVAGSSGREGAVEPSDLPTSGRRRRAPDMQLGKCPWIRLYDNVTYVVAGIALRADGAGALEILLIQEAKGKGAGKWYIPAGHCEPGETVEDACKREVREESGFECAVEHLVCCETRGSGWYRMAFAVTITGGHLKAHADHESLRADWYPVDTLLAKGKSAGAAERIPLRCRDFLAIVEEALKFHQWRAARVDGFLPLLNHNEQQPGLFIEFVIIHQSSITKKINCLVHRSVERDTQLLDDALDGFPTAEFGFEFHVATVISKCYRHILRDGHQSVEIPEAVLGMWCWPVPRETLKQGLRLRLLCRHKRSSSKADILLPQRYHWLALESEAVLASLYLLPQQYRPRLIML